jgi:O-antigen ligase
MVLAWNAIRAHPVLGVGLGLHGLAFAEETGGRTWAGVHNVYLEIAADLGIPALLIYLGAIGSLLTALKQCLKKLKRSRGKSSREARELAAMGNGIEIALAAFLVAAFFHPVSYHFYFYYVAGFSVAFQAMAERALPPNHGTPTVARLAVSPP